VNHRDNLNRGVVRTVRSILILFSAVLVGVHFAGRRPPQLTSLSHLQFSPGRPRSQQLVQVLHPPPTTSSSSSYITIHPSIPRPHHKTTPAASSRIQVPDPIRRWRWRRSWRRACGRPPTAASRATSRWRSSPRRSSRSSPRARSTPPRRPPPTGDSSGSPWPSSSQCLNALILLAARLVPAAWLAYPSALLCALQVAAGSVQLHRSREEEGETLQLIHLYGRPPLLNHDCINCPVQN
jgi:hypothetical protein